MDSLLPPGSESWTGAPYHLGTDGQGRDMLSAMMDLKNNKRRAQDVAFAEKTTKLRKRF